MSDPFAVPESLRYWDAIESLFNGGEIPRDILTGDYSDLENSQDKESFKNPRKRSFQGNKRGNLQMRRRGQFGAKRSNTNRQRREQKMKSKSGNMNYQRTNQRMNKWHNFGRKAANQSQKAKNQKQRRRRGREGSTAKLKRNSRSDCRRPNAESLVRQLYKTCEKGGVCLDDNARKIWESVNEIFARFSYVSPQLRWFITTEKFRRSFMFDGKRLTKNTNEYRLIRPTYLQKSDIYPFGLSNIDGKFPDPFARENKPCPKVPHTMYNCLGRCRRDNCNENPPKRGNISANGYVPNIISMPLHKFITADLKDFLDPFEGQLGYDTTTIPGAVMNVDGTHSFYKSGQKRIRSKLTRVSKWNGKNIWDGIGKDPYRMMPGKGGFQKPFCRIRPKMEYPHV